MRLAVKFEVVEALRFAVGHTGGVEVYSKELVRATPLPSTVLGAIGAALGVQLGRDVCRRECADLETLAERLGGRKVDLLSGGCEKPLLWGPLVEVGGHYYFTVGSSLVDVESRDGYVSAARRGEELTEERHSLKLITRVGITLLEEKKVVKTGLTYRASFYGYALKPYPASLVYAVDLADAAPGRMGVVRLGGEGRVAGLLFLELPEKLQELLSGGGEYAIALSPVLFHTEGEVEPGSTPGLKDVEEIVGMLTPEGVKLRAETVGLGFSEICGRRRPLLQALPPGTVLKLRDRSLRAVGLLSCLGYGSLLRVST
jgi:CRISPR-associated protein Cmr3